MILNSNKKICSVEGCNRRSRAKDYCPMHYQRFYYNPNASRSPLPIHEPYGPNQSHINEKCSIENCVEPQYAKKLCHNHYELRRRNGMVIYKKNLLIKCWVPNCDNKISIMTKTGLCRFHSGRKRKHTSLDRPFGLKGENNPNWKGGVAEYPDHYEMKKIRKQVLEEENYTCHYCGKPTKQIHHMDGSKDNHNRENLTACCHSCNIKRGKPRKVYNSKYRKLYGQTKNELKTMGFFKKGILRDQREEINEGLVVAI